MERPPRWEIDAMIPVSCVLIRQRRRETDGWAGGWTDRHREIRERERKYMCVCVSPCAWTEARKEKRKTLKPQTGIDEAKARGESLR